MFEREKNIETCPHGNVPEGCGACKLTLEEAGSRANAMRVMTGQGAEGAKRRARTDFVDVITHEATNEEYESADKELELFEQTGEHYNSNVIYKAIDFIERAIEGDSFLPSYNEISKRHKEAYEASMERGEAFAEERVNHEEGERSLKVREKKLHELYEKLKTRFEGKENSR
ncbi:MAG: hypothetical protein Q7R85_03975 [bacterium]|nr:hypothetical protein [bacterium]